MNADCNPKRTIGTVREENFEVSMKLINRDAVVLERCIPQSSFDSKCSLRSVATVVRQLYETNSFHKCRYHAFIFYTGDGNSRQLRNKSDKHREKIPTSLSQNETAHDIQVNIRKQIPNGSADVCLPGSTDSERLRELTSGMIFVLSQMNPLNSLAIMQSPG